ncbi:MAG: hypothetical protein JO057_02135 [Chloroflexi bacterium]|nr:hypothetical protein [Chloroflexota bacterium]
MKLGWFGRKRGEDGDGWRRVAASSEMREYFGFDEMAHRDDARRWFAALFAREPFTDEAVNYFKTLRLEVGTLDEPMGGGYWFGDRGLVMLRGTQEEAAVHELAHAWWETRRSAERDDLMRVLRSLGSDCPAGYARIGELASVYCNGIPTQADPNSPTGYWRGMLAEDNDHETFAGFCSGVMADASQMPPELRRFYAGFLR